MANANGATRPLDGLKVLDLTWFGAGPIGTRTLANLGADVVRVETEKRVDGLRVGAPRPVDAEGYNLSGYFNNFNAEKRSITIDLTSERGHELGIELVKWADVFVTNMTNRAIGKIGMTWEQISAANPQIVAMYQPMQGLTGPHAEFTGFGAILSTVCGVNSMTGFEGNEPRGSGTNYPDYVVNPIHLVIGVLAAVRHQRRTGEGQLIDMAQLESSVAAMAGPVFAHDNGGGEFRRAGNRVSFAAPHGAYPVQGDDRWLVLGCETDQQWQRFTTVADHADWATDARFATLDARKTNEDALDALVGEWAAAQDGRRAMVRLQAADVPAGMVQSASEVLADEQMVAREYFAYLDHPEAGRRAYDGPGFRLSKTPHELRRAAPMLGEHTHEIATELLQLSDDEIATLVAEQVLF